MPGFWLVSNVEIRNGAPLGISGGQENSGKERPIYVDM